jgi:hypothetical protein
MCVLIYWKVDGRLTLMFKLLIHMFRPYILSYCLMYKSIHQFTRFMSVAPAPSQDHIKLEPLGGSQSRRARRFGRESREGVVWIVARRNRSSGAAAWRPFRGIH